jgi:hypothetical protein
MDQLPASNEIDFLQSTSTGHGATKDKAGTEASQFEAAFCTMLCADLASKPPLPESGDPRITVWRAATVIDFASAEVSGG